MVVDVVRFVHNKATISPASPMAPQPTNPGQSPQLPPRNNIQLPQNFTAPSGSQPTQPPKTWQAPRLHPGEPISEEEKSPILDDFRQPLKRVGVAIAALFITGLLISLIVNAIAGLFRGAAPQPPASSLVAASPQVAISKEVAKAIPTSHNENRNACTDIPTKMKAAQISSQQVDRVFWQKHPDRVNKTLDLSAATDRTLRQEWCQIAGDLAAPKP